MHHCKYLLSGLLVPTLSQASVMLDFAQYHALLCYNHTTYCLFELVSSAEQENLPWSNVSFILRELQLLVRS